MRFAAGVLLCVATAACQPQQPAALSVEQAKQITTAFQGQSFVPPPRTIADITAVLDQERPDAAKVAAARAAADRQPPADVAGLAAARFYYDRGLAARELGRLPQQLADLRRAAALTPSGTSETSVIRVMLQTAERGSGNLGKAIEIAEERAKSEPSKTRGMTIATLSQLVSYNVARGTLDAADRWLAQTQRLNAEAQTWQGSELIRPMWRYFAARAEADLLLARGHAAQAEARLRTALADVNEGLGNYDRWTVQGRDQISRDAIPSMRDGAIRHLAAALREQGRLVEAEVEARRALTNTLRRFGRYNIQTADALIDVARSILDQGRFAEAEALARAAIDIPVTIDARGSWTLAQAREVLASVQVAQSRWVDALETNAAMLRDLGDDPLSQQRFGGGNLDWATALIKVGRGQDAFAMAGRVRESRRTALGEQHYRTAEARALQAAALALQGDRAAALREFGAAVPILLEGAPQSAQEAESAKAQRLRLILDTYIRLLSDVRGTPVETATRIDAMAEAFRLADAARGRSVQRAVSAASARATVSDSALADLARREQDAATQLAALEGVLTNVLSTQADQQNAGGIQALRGQIDQLRQARGALVRELGQRFPSYAQLVNPLPATIESARQALGPGEALVATYVADDVTLVWAVPQQGSAAFARVPMGAVPLAEAVKQLRHALDPQPQTIGDIPAFDVALASRLYTVILKPVERGWKGATTLLVVSDGALAQLPLGVLVTEPTPTPTERAGEALFASYKSVPFLARQVAVTQLPSVAALASLHGLPAASSDRKPFVGFGDPWFSPEQATQQATQIADLRAGETATRGGARIRFRSAPATAKLDTADLARLPRLPDTADEVREVARALKADPDKDVFVGAAASERTVKAMELSDRRVVMFATHGLVPGDLNGLTQPALALAAPQLAGGEGDGLLTVDKVLALKLNADWVVLSACNTAAGDGAGAEAVSGLGRAFFYAGARALLVSNWPVETTSARVLTTDVFRRQADNTALSRAEALRQAELALVDGDGLIDPTTQKVAFSYAHPIFWAPFSLVGDGGGGGVR